jgi:hypothetical protein
LSSQQSLAGLRQRLTANIGEAAQARSQLASVAIDAQQGISQLAGSLQSLRARPQK